jgi:hypothetical protein
VGIGTSSPANKLTVTADDTFAQDSSGQIVIRGSSNNSEKLSIGFDTTSNYGYIQAIEAGVASRSLALNPFGGNVGIGTSPDFPLHVSSTGVVLGLNATSGAVSQRFNENGTARFFLSTLNGSNGLAFVNGDGTTERMRIDESGNLMVGTTSSTGHVTITSSQYNAMSVKVSANGNVGASWKNVSGTEVGYIQVNASATLYSTASDIRLKENIVNAPSASDDVDAIQVRSFNWKADGSHQKYGMIAQELQTVAPEAVTEGETKEDMMGVDYSKLVPMMIKEIQSLRARITTLEGA